MSCNYNIDPILWHNQLASTPDRTMFIRDGHVFSSQDGCLARFDDTASAKKCLVEAGYVVNKNLTVLD